MVKSWSSLAVLAFLSMTASAVNIPTTSSLIFYHGRWDTLPSSWWPGSGFKLAFTKAPTSLTINIAATASTPPIPVGLRFGDSGEYKTLNLTTGANALPLSSLLPASPVYPLTFDVVTLWEGGEARLELKSLDVDASAVLTTYTTKKIALEFIGDSLTAGYINPRGSLDAYAFKVGEAFGAEHNQIAQSGACLVTKSGGCWGNPLGQVDLYFKTQNSAFQWLNGNTTTAWDFTKYGRATPTHVIIALGTNDQSNNVTSADFQSTYVTFLKKLRAVYPTQHIFAMTPWGWPYNGGASPYWEAEHIAAVSTLADPKIYLMKGLGWLPYGPGVNYYDDGHPTPTGHSIIAGNMVTWLKNWGLGGTTSSSTTSRSTSSSSSTTRPTTTSAPTTLPTSCVVAKYGQCDGIGYTGCKVCASGTTCTKQNDWYSQCL